jgi:glyoxylase-like metal-dependent hydrolase (beta-lactamase superfamily II)
MAFRHDRNFWVLGAEGEPRWGRNVAPWAPFQSASLAGGAAHGVGLAYSRVTGPQPTLSLFGDERGEETALVDSLGALGWIRYGTGDWRTGWVPSLIGDLVARAGDSIVTVRGHDGALRVDRQGRREKFPLPDARPYRLAPSADGSALALGFIVPEPGAESKSQFPWPRALLSVAEGSTAKERWSFAPVPDAPRPPALPDPEREFPALAESFDLGADAPLPCRVAVAVSPDATGAGVALADYGAWLKVRRRPAVGKWDPPYRAIPFVPRQRGTLRVVTAPGREAARVPFPKEGLFDLRFDPAGGVVWCFPMAWFARGMAGAAWLPADGDARTVHAFDVARGAWERTWEFPDAVADLALHPDGRRAWVSCWDGGLYLLHRDGRPAARVEAGGPARLRWSPDGTFAVAGTDRGEVLRLDGAGPPRWRTRLPAADPAPLDGPLKPVFEGLPVYSVGRVGREHAYVGDTWLIRAGSGGILVDAGGSSAVPQTLQKIRAAGADPAAVRHLIHSHSHGDHAGAAYLWRAMGLRIVAPETAALTTSWLMPTLTDYGVWVPRPVDVPLALKRAGDEADFALEGLRIRAVFVPGHSYDSAVYLLDLGGKRVAFTGDLGFKGQDILHRCWGDAEKAAAVTEAIRTKVLEFRPDVVFTGHDAHREGTAFLEDLVARSLESIRKARGK